jgi:pimeloyl-ACP methyl ester carboxylesterase
VAAAEEVPVEAAIQRPGWLATKAWPWPVRAVATPAGRIAFTDVGSGPILLLAHVGSWSLIWRDLLLDLADDFRVVAFDAPGTGLGEQIRWRQASLSRAAQAVTALVDARGLGRFTLVVHNLGGAVGVAAVATMPERVDGIVAINAFAWRQASRTFRSAIALIGSGPMRELDATTGADPPLDREPLCGGQALAVGRAARVPRWPGCGGNPDHASVCPRRRSRAALSVGQTMRAAR